MSVSLRPERRVTYVNVPVNLYVDVDVGFYPTPYDVNYYINEVVIETSKGGRLISSRPYSLPLEVNRRYYSWVFQWSVGEVGEYSVRAGWRLLPVPLPYGSPQYVWSEPITISVSEVLPPEVPPPPPELIKWLGIGVLSVLGVGVITYMLRKRR